LLLAEHVANARPQCASLRNKRVTPHVLRHYAGFQTIPGELILGLIGGSLASIFPA
jgi:hypothetical protein